MQTPQCCLWFLPHDEMWMNISWVVPPPYLKTDNPGGDCYSARGTTQYCIFLVCPNGTDRCHIKQFFMWTSEFAQTLDIQSTDRDSVAERGREIQHRRIAAKQNRHLRNSRKRRPQMKRQGKQFDNTIHDKKCHKTTQALSTRPAKHKKSTGGSLTNCKGCILEKWYFQRIFRKYAPETIHRRISSKMLGETEL